MWHLSSGAALVFAVGLGLVLGAAMVAVPLLVPARARRRVAAALCVAALAGLGTPAVLWLLDMAEAAGAAETLIETPCPAAPAFGPDRGFCVDQVAQRAAQLGAGVEVVGLSDADGDGFDDDFTYLVRTAAHEYRVIFDGDGAFVY